MFAKGCYVALGPFINIQKTSGMPITVLCENMCKFFHEDCTDIACSNESESIYFIAIRNEKITVFEH